MDVFRWTSKSKTKLAEALAERGHRLAPNTVGRLLRDLDYSLQANRKDKEGRSPPERGARVAYLNEQARTFLERGQPVISVDAKKKELVGDFKNAGRTWHPKGQPVRVQVHDFPSMSVGKAGRADPLPVGRFTAGSGRQWEQQQRSQPAVENAAPGVGRRAAHPHHRLSSAAWHQQVEQN